MDAIPFTRLRGNLTRETARVSEDHAPIIVTREASASASASASAVMMSQDDYEASEESLSLLRSPKNAELLESHTELGPAAAPRATSQNEGRLLGACVRGPPQHAHPGHPTSAVRGSRQARTAEARAIALAGC